jgi:hypothetical protein
MRFGLVRTAGFVVLVCTATAAYAGPYGDTLSKCLVSSSTASEKITLIQWVFSTISLHPDVQSMAVSVTAEKRAQVNKELARTFERLLTDACRAQTMKAVKYEGVQTVQNAFQLLGQVAMRELFTNPKVAEGLEEFSKNVDPEKLKEVLAPAQP